jgi:alpha-tubulin suppressor-like RCC1 family protein
MKTQPKLTSRLALPVLVLISGFLNSQLHAQNTLFTYQGRVTANGTNFTGAGQFKFALVTSTNFNHQATAVANPPSGGFITIINVSFGGSGYLTPPAVTISGGGGLNAAAHANISGGVVTSIIVDNPGSGYSSTPSVTVAPPPANITYTTYWSNDGTSVAGSEPAAAVSVAVNAGLFTVVLGDSSVPNMAVLSAALFAQPNLQLRIWFNDGVHGSAVLNPAQNLTPAPYAIEAANAIAANTAATANSVAAANIVGTLASSQLPSSLVTNNEGGVNLTGAFAGNGGSLSNLSANALVLSGTNVSITGWGNKTYGALDIPAGLDDAIGVSPGAAHSLALRANGTVVAWGRGTTNDPSSGADYGQSIVPPGLSNVTAVAAGYIHSLALRANGTVVAWGAGTTNDPSNNVQSGQAIVPPGLSNVVAISAGLVHNLVLLSNRTAVAWGGGTTYDPSNSIQSGQSIVPPGLSNVVAVSAGGVHSLALLANGTVVAWGRGMSNNPSDGVNFGQAIVPAGLGNVIAISAGYLHSMALKSDGTVVAWGAGTTNDPSTTGQSGQSIVPSGLSNVVAIAVGLFHSVALKSDGTLVAWGDHTFNQADVPPGLNNVVLLGPSTVSYHTLVLRRRSTAPVAWLDSDNTFNGNIQVNGDVHLSGELTVSNGFRLNDGNLWLRTGLDQENALGWYGTNKTFANSSDPLDGPVLFGNGTGALGTTSNGNHVAVFWDTLHVGIGTVLPNAKLSLGNDQDNTKLLLYDGGPSSGVGLGASSGQLILHTSGANNFDSFAFLNGPAGTEVFSVNGFGNAILQGSLQVNGNLSVPASPENLRIVRGVVGATGTIVAGQGFTVTKGPTGFFTLNFSPGFSDIPAVTVTPQSGIGRIATCTSVSSTSAGIWTRDNAATATDNQFNFIAIGPR